MYKDKGTLKHVKGNKYIDNKICLLKIIFVSNSKQNVAIFPNSKGPGPSPENGCESPGGNLIRKDGMTE